MNKIFGFMFAIIISGHAMAYTKDDSPPFNSLVCKTGDISVEVDIKHNRQTHGSGPAAIESGTLSWYGEWSWKKAQERTRLTGYHFLYIKAYGENGPISIRTLYTPNGELSGGWIEMAGVWGSIDCKIVEKIETQNQCVIRPQNDCSISPRRLCCDCIGGQRSCY